MKWNSIIKITSILSISAFMVIFSCKKDSTPLQEKDLVDTLVLSIPDYFPAPQYNFKNNPLTKEGFELGKKLFFDRVLSVNNTVSCGTCHQQSSAFSQIGHDLSHGTNGNIGTRNSQPIFNLMWNTSFFWDGGANHIEVQPINPITHPDEMGNTLENVIETLNSIPEYRVSFKKVFNKDYIDTEGIMKALAQYMAFIISADSKYDKIQKGMHGYSFTPSEERGYVLFQQKCNTCHIEPLFTDNSFRNNGLAIRTNTKGVIDLGRGVITPFDSTSYYKFRVPTLRNLKYTHPYMHDGRYETLSVVLEHYINHIQQTSNLDPLLRNKITLTTEEKDDLLSFLNTLNDETFINNPILK
jgi:cytochrome c peroxidase